MSNDVAAARVDTEANGLDERSLYLRRLVVRGLAGGGRGHVGSSLSLIEITTMTSWSTGRRSHSGAIEIAPFSVKGTDASHCTLSWQTKVSFRLRSSTGSAGGHQSWVAIPRPARCPGWKHRPERLVTDYRSALDVRSLCVIRSSANKHRLSNLIALIDYNKIQSAGRTSEILELEPLADKWRSFGFAVAEVDGHDVNALRKVLKSVPLDPEKPTAVICHTIKGKGIPFAEEDPEWHHKSSIKADVIRDLYAALESA